MGLLSGRRRRAAESKPSTKPEAPKKEEAPKPVLIVDPQPKKKVKNGPIGKGKE